jgi:hypothetical protein
LLERTGETRATQKSAPETVGVRQLPALPCLPPVEKHRRRSRSASQEIRKRPFPGGPFHICERLWTLPIFCGVGPALGAKSLIEGRRRFGIGSPRPRGLPLGFGQRWFHDWLPLRFMPRRLVHCLGALARRFGISAGGIKRCSGAYASSASPLVRMVTSSIAVHPARPKLTDGMKETSIVGAHARNWYSPSATRVPLLGIATYSEGDTTRLPRG